MQTRFNAGKIVDNNLYYSMMGINALCRLDLNTMKSMCIGVFPGEEEYKYILHKACIRYKNLLVFIPIEASNIHIYNLESGEIKAVYCGKRRHSPVDAVVYKNKLWIIPSIFEDELLILDLTSLKIEVEDKFSNWCKKIIHTTEKLKIHRIALIDDVIWFSVYKSDIIISLNLNLFKFSMFRAEGEVFAGAFPGRDGLWISTLDEKKIIKWSISEKRVVNKIITLEEDIRETGVSNIVEINNKIFIIPGYGNNIYSFMEKEGQMRVLANYLVPQIEAWPKFIRYGLYRNKLLLFPCNFDFMCEINVDTDEVEELLIINNGFFDGISSFQREIYGETIYKENTPFSLKEFISVGDERKTYKYDRCERALVGEKVVRRIKMNA